MQSLCSIIRAAMHVMYTNLTSCMFIFIVLLVHFVLHTAQPAAVTTVAMETRGVSEEQARREREDGEKKREAH